MGGVVVDFDNLFDVVIVCVDETICGYMGMLVIIIFGEQLGVVICGVFDDFENISYVGQGVCVEGFSLFLFVWIDEVWQLWCGDMLIIGEENFWVDWVLLDDGGSCYFWFGWGVLFVVNCCC